MKWSITATDEMTSLRYWRPLSKQVIASINGPAIADGLELVVACDLRIMNKDAFVELPEVSFGLNPGCGGTQHLLRLFGMSRAKQMVLLYDQVDAEKALGYGLVNLIDSSREFECIVNSINQ